MTENTLDEIFHYASRAKEKRMYRTIENIKKDLDNGTFNPNSEIEKQKKDEQKKLF
jgi:ERCC4-related helicase